MSELRGRAERKADVLAALEQNHDLWLATASPSGQPHLIAVSSWWDGHEVVIATRAGSPTARNLAATKLGRLGLGSPEDVVTIDVALSEQVPVRTADADLKKGFVVAAGWDPAEEGDDWVFYRLQPLQVQAYRGYSELRDRHLMRDSPWLV
ncbi:MAG: pyridoxamine 5'-phosphate oxidase family protein [Chloroflexi bacterium]|nr:MAG: pyridoxamine 5'-phosphate oxidase family protein [Chloroflexota bacterium]TME47021.1 MAG: pyridoxamine 5'-phosphate oxidase family protein [Chloroflexota bacterium]